MSVFARTTSFLQRSTALVATGAVACTVLTVGSGGQSIAQDLTATPRVGSATVKGLYGAQDPTYNAVFRQGFSILALKAAKGAISADALTWLGKQQCANGSFSAYRADLAAACSPPNPETYSGSDSNSTSLGAAALAVTGRTKKANKAISWLRSHQNPDGGWAYYSAPGATSDANSTGLVVMALAAAGKDPAKIKSKSGKSASQYLRSVQKRCAAPATIRGGLRFQKVPPASVNNLTSAQASLGLLPLVRGTGTTARVATPAKSIRKAAPKVQCGVGRGDVPTRTTSTRDALLGYLSRTINSNSGAIPSAYGSSPDVGSTANAVTSLASAGYGRTAVTSGLTTLRSNAGTYLVSPSLAGPNAADPGALAYYILAVKAAGKNPRNFAGLNLVATLKSTIQP